MFTSASAFTASSASSTPSAGMKRRTPFLKKRSSVAWLWSHVLFEAASNALLKRSIPRIVLYIRSPTNRTLPHATSSAAPPGRLHRSRLGGRSGNQLHRFGEDAAWLRPAEVHCRGPAVHRRLPWSRMGRCRASEDPPEDAAWLLGVGVCRHRAGRQRRRLARFD